MGLRRQAQIDKAMACYRPKGTPILWGMSDNTQLIRAVTDAAANATAAARSASTATGNAVKAAQSAQSSAASAIASAASAASATTSATAAAASAATAGEAAVDALDAAATATPTANAIPKADSEGKLDPGWLPTAAAIPLVTVYTCFGRSEAGPLPCIGVRVGDRVCGGSAFDSSQSAFPITVFRSLHVGRGSNTFDPDVVERVVTVDDQIQQTDNEDWSAAQFFIVAQSMS